jgi:hypothetical protein
VVSGDDCVVGVDDCSCSRGGSGGWQWLATTVVGGVVKSSWVSMTEAAVVIVVVVNAAASRGSWHVVGVKTCCLAFRARAGCQHW